MRQDWLAMRARSSPAAIALIIGERHWTYSQLDALVNRTVVFLSETGVRPGQFVAALMSNSLEFVCMVHGLARLGAVLVPLNTRLAAPELRWQLQHTDCIWLFHDGAMATKAEALSDVGCVLEDMVMERLEEKPPQALHLSPKTPFDLDGLQSVMFTSGTTGYPKGVMLTFSNHFWSATASAFRLGTRPEDRWLSCLPLYHVGGAAILFRACLYGICVVLQDRFDVESFNWALDHQEITLVSLVPTMLYRLLESRADGEWPGSCRLVLLGGAAASSELIARCRQQNIPVATTYGLTEAASQVATMLPEGAYSKPGSVGKPLMFSSVRIADEHGRTVPPGAYGEVIVSGKTVMSGYFNDPGATADSLRDGELYTGDVGYLDADGDLWLVQRREDIIISGGENVYPAEVEAVLRQHPAVAAACVVGVDDEEWGQRVGAAIVLKNAELVTKAELVRFCRERMAGYKLPRLISFVDQLPQTASGKIQRRAVSDLMNRNVASQTSGEGA